MAKRRAEGSVLHDSPSKRCGRSLCGVDMQPGSMAPCGGVSPPSLLALLGSRCRKRPQYFEDPERREEAALKLKPTNCDTNKRHAANVMRVHTPGGFHERQRTGSVKRAREDCTSSETVSTKVNDTLDEAADDENCTYNSFQYWRVPLPALDLSLLEDTNDDCQPQDRLKAKDSSSDFMET